jgi:hypothetical protein
MPNPRRLRTRLTRKVIQRFGLDTFLFRADPSSGSIAFDRYGEPNTLPWPLQKIKIRIVVDTDKRNEEKSDIGGLEDHKKDFIYFWVSGDYDIRIGDNITYPANSVTSWTVEMVNPNMYNDVCIITEVRASRDARY